MILILQSSSASGSQFWWFFPLLFVGLWVTIPLVISRIGGWSTLADYYRSEQPFSGEIIRVQSATLRFACSYNGCLNFGADRQGLFLVPMWLFRAFHPALFVPWNEVTAEPYKLWFFFDAVRLRFGRVPQVPISISRILFDRLRHSSGDRLQLGTKNAGMI